jgi:hypothetical protein
MTEQELQEYRVLRLKPICLGKSVSCIDAVWGGDVRCDVMLQLWGDKWLPYAASLRHRFAFV